MLDSFAEFHIPKPGEVVPLIMRDGAEVRLRRYGNPLGPRLALSHGNGLAINSYAPFWLPLTSQFDIVVLRCAQSR